MDIEGGARAQDLLKRLETYKLRADVTLELADQIPVYAILGGLDPAGIPDGSRDLIPEKSTMDEARMDTLNAIDYDKGCYVGQELTARMHYRGLGKKHLEVVDIHTLPEKSDLRSTCGDIGLALVRAT